MKIHTNYFKEEIKKFGRQIDSKITYELDGETIELGGEELNSITPHYESAILKSVMKQLDIDSNVEIPKNTIINCQFGLLVNDSYEYINYGNYVVYDVEKQEDSFSYKITCYDKMLYSMIPYESLGVEYPITIKDYLSAICDKLGLTLESDNFANYDKEIQNELYLDNNGNSLDYTFRDVLDEIAQATGSIICINEETDGLEVRYENYTSEKEELEIDSSATIENGLKLEDLEIEGNTSQSGTPTPSSPQPINVVSGRQTIDVVGKNLLIPNVTSTTTVAGEVTITPYYKNAVIDYYIINGTSTSSSAVFVNMFSYKGQPSTSYTLTGFVSNTNLRLRVWRGSGYVDNSNPTFTFTTTDTDTNYGIQLRIASGGSFDNVKIQPMLRLSSITDDTYEPYKEQSYEINLGKNLFDKDNIQNIVKQNNSSYTILNNGIRVITTRNSGYCDIFIVLGLVSELQGKTQTISYNVAKGGSGNNSIRTTMWTLKSDYSTSRSLFNNTNDGHQEITYTVPNATENDVYLGLLLYSNNGSTTSLTGDYVDYTDIQIEKGSQATSYSAYKTPIELCKISTYKDRIYKDNGKWYIEKQIGKVVLDGSENISLSGNLTSVTRFGLSLRGANQSIPQLNSHFTYSTGYSKDEEHFYVYNNLLYLFINNSIATTVADFKTWLSTHNVAIYYVLATPTTTEITDTELISQLNAIELLEGTNNISITSSDLTGKLMLTYYNNELDTIDEEYLKDINVNFGQKYGPVNSIVLSRSAESDNIYLRDEQSVEENGLCEIKIKDNQIMNFNDRDQYLPDLLDKLNGLEYYINDFASTAIMYYNLFDNYYVKIGDSKYKCIMFNDEVNITQGLEENIYTEMPEETQTDYTKSDKTDRKINQAYIIVDKQNQEINSVVQTINSNINNLTQLVDSQGNDIGALGTRLTQSVDSINASVSAVQQEINNGVGLVKTTSATLDDNGLSISTDTSKIKTTMTNNSFEIKDSGGNSLAFFGYDETEGISKAVMDNLTVTNYFIAGVHRIETYEEDGEERTGYFYIGG